MFFQIAIQNAVAPGDLLTRSWRDLDDRLRQALQALEAGVPENQLPPHIAYAWLWETTRVVEIFRRVVESYVGGERLGIPDTVAARRWVETTEALIYSDQPPGAALNVTSWVRPDAEAVRRNSYARLLGGLGGGDQGPGGTTNAAFPVLFHQLLEQVWIGITNRANTSGANPTDDATIAEKARRLFEMLTARRRSGNLLREEFVAVTSMAWFHLTLGFDSPVIVSLTAQAPSPAERLQQVGSRVDVAPDPRTVSLIELAEPMSDLLRLIERGVFNDEAGAALLYADPALRGLAQEVINHWTAVTGRDARAVPTRAEVTALPAPPAVAPGPAALPAPS